jgi:anti-sigma B factor antagonist
MEMLTIDLVRGEQSILRVKGEIDFATADQLRTALKDALSVDPSVIVDMAGVTFIDVSGLRVVLEAAESRDGLGPLTLLDAPRVAWLLEVVGLSDLASIEIRDRGEQHGS